jgi:hypothetical protein
VSVVARLNDRRFNGQRIRRIPHPFDDEVIAVIEAYRQSTAEQRRAMRDELGQVGISVLCTFPDRLAAVAVRTRSAEPLRQGLVALGMIADLLDDPRDHLYGLAAINHSAGVLGTDLSALTDSVADEVPPTAVAQFRAFAARAERDKSLAAFNLRTQGSGDQFRYC